MNSTSPQQNQPLQELISCLLTSDKSGYDNIIRKISLPAALFSNYSSWSKESYTRNCIVNNDQFELILLCWEPGQITPIHDHGGEECWVKVIEGDFKEVIYKEQEDKSLEVVKSSVATVGDITYMIDFMGVHSLENLSNKRSMSLHLYAKPIGSCNYFDKSLKKFIKKELAYNTIAEL